MIHILPVKDIDFHEESPSCHCGPKIDTSSVEMICVHNSFDGREIIEEIDECVDINMKIELYTTYFSNHFANYLRGRFDNLEFIAISRGIFQKIILDKIGASDLPKNMN